MYKTAALSALLVPLTAGLATEYSTGTTLRIETTTSFTMETTESRFEIDGEPMDRGGRGGASSEQSRSFVTLDTVMESADGAPSKVRRVFDSMESSGAVMMGDNEYELSLETPLNGVTLEISDGEIEVVDGDEPEDEAMLEGHSMSLALDALLPDKAVEVGDSWELDGDAIMRALSMDIEGALFAPPTQEWRGEGGGEEGRGRRGGRRGRRQGGSPSRLMAEGDWTAKATLVSMEEEHESGACAKIMLELKCSGEMPERERGEGRRRRDGAPFAMTAPTRLFENSFELDLEGELYFHIANQRPVELSVEGTIGTTRTMERSSERGDFFMYSAQEGEFHHTVTISEAKADEESEDKE